MRFVLLLLAVACGIAATRESRAAAPFAASTQPTSPSRSTSAPAGGHPQESARCIDQGIGNTDVETVLRSYCLRRPAVDPQPRHLSDIDADMPRDPWRQGDPHLAPRKVFPGIKGRKVTDDARPGAQPTWQSPLASNVFSAQRERRPVASFNGLRAPPGQLTRVITEIAQIALGATGRISGTGRDTTGDIGKPLLGNPDERYRPGVQGGIR